MQPIETIEVDAPTLKTVNDSIESLKSILNNLRLEADQKRALAENLKQSLAELEKTTRASNAPVAQFFVSQCSEY